MPTSKKSRRSYADPAIPKPADSLHDLRETQELTGATAVVSAVTGMSLKQAQEVLRKVGGAHELAQLSEPVLMTLPHIGKRRARQIHAMTEWALLLTANGYDDRTEIRTPEDVAKLLMTEMSLLQQEELRIIGLDSRYHVKLLETIYRGSIYRTNVRVAEIFSLPVSLKCAAIILIHNHPTGDLTPSREDIHLTDLVRKCGEQLDIELRDHLIFGRQRYVSLRQRGLGFEV